jgi:hypothetical protein
VTTIRLRRNTASGAAASNPVLLAGEPGVETDTGKLKIGNGSSNWNALPYVGTGTSDEYHEYANLAAFPVTGTADRVYLAQDTGKLYRWNGSTYVQLADKASVGLASVDNTSDTSKPVSTAQQTALDGKVPNLVPTAVKTSAYTAAVADLIPADTTSAAFTVTLPSAPADKARIVVKKIDATANVVTVTAGGADVFNRASGSTSLTLQLQNQAIQLQYKATGAIWYVISTDVPLGGLDTRYASIATKSGNLKINFADKANSATVPAVFDTLQTVSELVGVGTNSQGIINNGAYTFAPSNGVGTAADYLRYQLPANITRGRLTYQLGGTGGICMAWGKQAIVGGQVPDLAQHLSEGSVNSDIGYWDGPTGGNTGYHSLNATSWTTYGQAPTLDGFTTYVTETVHVGNKIYLFRRDGSSMWVTNAAVASNAGQYGFIEVFNNVGTDTPARIISFEAWTGYQPVPLDRYFNLTRRATATASTTLTASTPANPAGIVSNTFLCPASGSIKCTLSVFFNVVTAGDIFMGCIPYATGSSRYGGAYYDQVQSTSGAQMLTVVQYITGLTPGQWYTVVPEVMSTASDTQYVVNTAQGKYHALTVEPVIPTLQVAA